MKKCFIMCLATLLTISVSWAQDIIVTTDAQKIEAKIIEVSKSEIKYKEIDNLEGPTFILSIEEISSVIYSNGKVVLYNQKEKTETQTETHEQSVTLESEESHEATYNCEIHLLSGDIIKGRIMEKANDYVAYTLNAKYYTVPASQVEYVKDLRNGKITKYLGSTLDPNSSGSQYITTSTKQQVYTIPKYVSRTGNTYYYDGRAMNEESYDAFLQANCPDAYDLFHKGSNIAYAGWIFFAVGVGCDLGSGIGYLITGGNSATTVFSIVGLGCEIASIPTLIVGYSKKHKSVDVYNSSCQSKVKAYWSINASKNGIGIAYNF